MEVTVERPCVVEEIKKDTLESTREEIGEVKQENERLKMILSKIMNDYQSLQTQLLGVVNKGVEEEPPESAEEAEMVSLSLGTSSWRQKKEERSEQAKREKRDFSLCLGTQSSSSHENSLEDAKEEEIGDLWPPSKALKAMKSGDDEISESIHVRKARVSVRARCDAPTMNDGCQWRKYGQKIAKGNPCPRAYYRCTISPGCPVRKQVQRCAEDMSILITTYEGIHNHPLPIAATSMASTTSAAAGMLASGPLPSRPSIPAPTMAPSSFNFSFLDDPKHKQLYLPNASITSSPSHATITLDLTTPPSSSHSNFSSRFSQSSFSFSSPEGNPIQATPQWNSPFMSNGSQIFNSRINLGAFSQQPREAFYHPHTHKQTHNKIPLPDSIAAATKVITADPGFQTALAAAITSAVGGKNAQGMTETLLKNLRWSENLSAASNLSSSTSGNGCSYITRPTASSSSIPENSEIRFLKPTLNFSGRKSAASSPPADSRH